MTTELTKLQNGMPPNGYPDHPIASIFPWMKYAQWDKFHRSVKYRGVLEPIVLMAIDGESPDEFGVLDGRIRQKAALMHGQIPPFCLFDPKLHGESALAYSASMNLFPEFLFHEGRLAMKLLSWSETLEKIRLLEGLDQPIPVNSGVANPECQRENAPKFYYCFGRTSSGRWYAPPIRLRVESVRL